MVFIHVDLDTRMMHTAQHESEVRMEKTQEPMTAAEIRPLLAEMNLLALSKAVSVSRNVLIRIRDVDGYSPTYGTRSLLTGYFRRRE